MNDIRTPPRKDAHTGNVGRVLLATGASDRLALIHKDRSVTYGELRHQVEGFAAGLQDRGLSRGAHLGIVARNSPFFVVAYLGAILAGCVAVPIAPDAGPERVEAVIQALGIRDLLVERRSLRSLPAGMDHVRVWTDTPVDAPRVDGSILDLIATGEVREETGPDDLAALMLTSGSTGEPKAVMVTHGNIEANTRDIVDYLSLTPRDRVMAVLPLHYCFGTSLLHTHLLAGGGLVLSNGLVFPELALDEMEDREVTNLAGVPSTFQILLRRSSFPERELPSMRLFQQAGGRLAEPFIQEIVKAFPNVDFYTMYGQTEGTARLSYLPPERLVDKLGSIGRGLPSTKLEVVGPDGRPVGPGEVGEIIASGPNITLGYYEDPVETAEFFRDGRLWTGDLARVDDDGFIFIVGRGREFLKPMGHRVSPLEIEAVISELPGVVEAGVFGVFDPVMGEAIRAVVVIQGDEVKEAEIVRHCRARLPEYEVPRDVRIVGWLPKNSQGKMVRAQLPTAFGADQGGAVGDSTSPLMGRGLG
jgi:long-chain acyl-CoA synthetase